mgnify:CR=1 FL=1
MIEMKAKYIGNCTDSFDSETGDCYFPEIFQDVSEFAYKDENSIPLDEEEFYLFVGEIPLWLNEEIKNHELSYLFYDGNIYVLYDETEDIHYFFKR